MEISKHNIVTRTITVDKDVSGYFDDLKARGKKIGPTVNYIIRETSAFKAYQKRHKEKNEH